MKIQKIAEKYITLFEIILKISKDDYKIYLSADNGGTIRIYIKDILNHDQNMIVATQAADLFQPDNTKVEYIWCDRGHRIFKEIG